jgi:hypothetical protein
MTPEDEAGVFDCLESINPESFKEGIITIVLAYFQDNVEMGMHTCLDRGFYRDLESLLTILSIRAKYQFDKPTD